MISNEIMRLHMKALQPMLQYAASNYHRLVLVAGGTWQERTALLRHAAQEFDLFYVAAGLPLSKALAALPARERPLAAGDDLAALLTGSRVGAALDHLEILFSAELKLNPLGLLQSLSTKRLLLASWPGRLENGYLVYAEPSHPEYFHQPAGGLPVYLFEGER